MPLDFLLRLQRTRSNFARAFLIVFSVLVLCTLAPTVIAENVRRDFKISEGRAVNKLKKAARQGDVDIMIAAKVAKGVRTNAVNGTYSIQEVLDRMLQGTVLTPIYDDVSGGYAVVSADGLMSHEENEVSYGELKTLSGKGVVAGRLINGVFAVVLGGNESNLDVSPYESQEPDVFVLSPFTVSSYEDYGYVVERSVAGSRLKVPLEDISIPMDIINPELMDDFNLVQLDDLFDIASNLEDRNDDFISSVFESGTSYRLRGFIGNQGLRNFLQGGMSFDRYNATRLLATKGPNSILFGGGVGGGIVNFNTRKYSPSRQDSTEVLISADSEGSIRAEFRADRSILKDKLGVHLAWFSDRKEFEIEPSYENRRGYYVSGTFIPWQNTTVTASYETRSEEVYRGASNYTMMGDKSYLWEQYGRPAIVGGGTRLVADEYGNVETEVPSVDLQVSDKVFLEGQDLQDWSISQYAGIPPTIVDGRIIDYNSSYYFDTYADTRLPKKYGDPLADWPREVGATGLNGGTEVVSEALDFSVEHKLTDDFYLMLSAGKVKLDRFILPQRIRDLWVDANLYRPDGTMNPNYGDYYIEMNYLNSIDASRDTESVVFTAAYELDLDDKSEFLGVHNFSFMREDYRDETSSIRQRIVMVETPDGVFAPDDYNDLSNTIGIRHYLDVSNGIDVEDAMPDYRYIYRDGYEVDGYRWELLDGVGASNGSIVETKSNVLAVQSKFLGSRFISNFGYREEGLDQFVMDYVQDPELNNRYTRQGGEWGYSSRVARNLGAILKVTPRIALVGNRATSSSASVGRIGIFGQNLPSTVGMSKDYGIRLNLFDERIRLEYTRYETSENNTSYQTNRMRIPEDQVSRLWQMMVNAGLQSENVFEGYAGWDTRDFVSRGHELTLVGNPIDELSVRLAVSYNEQVASNLGGTFMPWWRKNSSQIESFVKANPSVVLDSGGQTAAELWQESVEELELREHLDGLPNLNSPLWAVKGIAKYRFVEGWLEGAQFGVNVAWRGRQKSGFFIDEDDAPDPDRPYYSESTFFTHIFWSYARDFKISNRSLNWKIQMNVNNLFDSDTTVNRGSVNLDRYDFESPVVYTDLKRYDGRRITLTNTLSF